MTTRTLSRLLLGLCVLAALGLLPAPVAAQVAGDGNGEAGGGGSDGVALDGPPAPVPPAVVTRDGDGRVTMRAFRLPGPLTVDGRLDEEVYTRIESVSDFIQQEPAEGAPATERTEVWVFFDERNVYISARNWDSHPERIVANEMRRDHRNINQNQTFTVVLDTFYDRRNGFFFQTNPLGALRDQSVTDERNANNDWNTVWDVKTQRFEQGWTAEMVIPFKSLRYNEGREQVWGVNFRRNIQWKNESSFLTPIPASYNFLGIYKFSSAATLVGIQAPAGSRNIELKPFAITSLTTDRVAEPALRNDLGGDVGFDAKYGLTQSLIADFTVNTDFAQVEDDDQQVNLTRFSLFFPEKREFFLEGQGIFAFGGASGRQGGGGFMGRRSLTPIMFFSRRIGLGEDGAVPIRAGTRVTGRAGAYTVGLLNIQQGEEASSATPATNFSVVRLRRDILRRSNIGVIATNRSAALNAPGSSQTYGIDGDFAFFENLRLATYYARTEAPDLSGGNDSYFGTIDYAADEWGFAYEHLTVGEHFEPEVGFQARDDFRRNFASARYSPRTTNHSWIRQVSNTISLDYITDTRGRLETREASAEFQIQMHNSDFVSVNHGRQYEYLDAPFEISDGVTLPVGGYGFQDTRVNYRFGPQRRFSGFANVSVGSFYNGHRTQVGYGGRVEVTSQLSLEPNVSLNWVDLEQGSFTTTLLRTRVNYTLSPRTFVGALLQFNSASEALLANIRFRWEYEPGSDLFVVYSEGRDTLSRGFPGLENRSFVIKMTRLLRF